MHADVPGLLRGTISWGQPCLPEDINWFVVLVTGTNNLSSYFLPELISSVVATKRPLEVGLPAPTGGEAVSQV